MPTSLFQTSFAAGELSPSLYARVDLSKYKVGAATLRNFYIDYRGGASSRPGTRYIATSATPGSGLPPRLIGFQFSTLQTYVLELGAGQSAEYRMNVRSKFDGPVQPGRDYLIVDDNVTQGGTLADLRSYIESRGGRVVAATTLTGSRESQILAPRAETLAALRAKFPNLESRWRGTFGHDFSGLTHGEASYLLRSSGPLSRGDRVITRAQEGTASEVPRNRRPPGGGEEGYDGEDGGEGGGVSPPPGPAAGPSGGGDDAQASDQAASGAPRGMSRSEYMQWVEQQNLGYINKEPPYYQKVAAGWIDPERLARGEHWLTSVPEAEARLAELDRMEANPTQYPPEAVDAFYAQYLERHGAAGTDPGGAFDRALEAAHGAPSAEETATTRMADAAAKDVKPDGPNGSGGGGLPAKLETQLADIHDALTRADAAGLLGASEHAEIEAANSWTDQARNYAQATLQAAACIARGVM